MSTSAGILQDGSTTLSLSHTHTHTQQLYTWHPLTRWWSTRENGAVVLSSVSKAGENKGSPLDCGATT